MKLFVELLHAWANWSFVVVYKYKFLLGISCNCIWLETDLSVLTIAFWEYMYYRNPPGNLTFYFFCCNWKSLNSSKWKEQSLIVRSYPENYFNVFVWNGSMMKPAWMFSQVGSLKKAPLSAETLEKYVRQN